MRFAFACLAATGGILLVSVLNPSAWAKKPKNDVPKSITFDGQTLDLAWHGGDMDAPIYEYIPAGETLDAWTHLASIRQYPTIEAWKTLAGNTLKMVKQNYPGCPAQIVENPTTGETIIDFLIGPEDGPFVEYNCFKYGPGDDGGTVAQQYALRAYGKEDADKLLKELPEARSRILDEMAATGLQAE